MSVCISRLGDYSRGSLRPVTATSSGRYDEKPGAALSPCVIPPGMHTSSRDREPQYLPPYWSAHIHPEGQLYFYRSHPLRIVTEACVYDPNTLNRIVRWSAKVEELLEAQRIKTYNCIELFLCLKGEDCTYYLVDYVSRTQFWLESMSTDDLNLYGVLSPSHLQLHLQSLFWNHVEHFPMHSSFLTRDCVDELLSIMSHGLADKMTSTTSTFFYDKEQCQQYVKLLKTARDYVDDGHQICLVARFWATICDHRFAVHYGTQHCRLDRNRAVLWAEPEQVPWVSAVFSWLSFRNYDTHLSRMHDLFCDRYVYVEQWKAFITDNLQEWREISYKSLASLMLHLFDFFIPSSSTLGIMSFGLLSASLLTSVLLGYRYKALQNVCSSTARDHLTSIESTKHGFQFAAFTCCLPTALWLWGLGFFFLNCLYCVGVHFGYQVALMVSLLCIAALISFQRATSETSISFPSPANLLPHHKKDELMV